MTRLPKKLAALMSAMLAGACTTPTARAPAVLTDGGAENIAALKAGLGEALGRARIEFGAGDPTQSPVVAVLPPPPVTQEDRSLVEPVIFDLWIEDGRCFAVARETGRRTSLDGVSCRAI